MVRIKHFKASQTMVNFRIVQTGLMKEIPRNKTQHAARRHGITTVRVKGGMSLRNGMWHGLRNDIIMRNVKYGN